MAIGAIHRALRIIKRARALTRNSAGLPIVVFVEATNPAVTIYGNVQVNFVAGRTELRSVRAHERFQERAAVRLGIQAHDKVMQLANEWIFAGGQFMQLRIFQKEISLAHSAFHFHNAVAHEAAQARARFRTIHDLLDGRIEQAAVEQGGIVATGAPFRGAHAGDVLHVLDALAIPLIVERRKVVHRTVPLGVNIGVAALAGLRFHEVLRRNVDVVFGLRGTWEEFP